MLRAHITALQIPLVQHVAYIMWSLSKVSGLVLADSVATVDDIRRLATLLLLNDAPQTVRA